MRAEFVVQVMTHEVLPGDVPAPRWFYRHTLAEAIEFARPYAGRGDVYHHVQVRESDTDRVIWDVLNDPEPIPAATPDGGDTRG